MTFLWYFLIGYLLCLIIGVYFTLKYVNQGVHYPTLTMMQGYIGDKAIKKLCNKIQIHEADDKVMDEQLIKCNDKLRRIKAIIDEDLDTKGGEKQ